MGRDRATSGLVRCDAEPGLADERLEGSGTIKDGIKQAERTVSREFSQANL